MEKQIEIPKFCVSPKTTVSMSSTDYTKLLKYYKQATYIYFVLGLIIGFTLCALCLVVTAR